MGEAQALGGLISEHRRSITYRVIVLVLACLTLSICWAAYAIGETIVAISSGAMVVAASTWFWISQSREVLRVYSGGIGLQRKGPVWRVAWQEVAGVLLIFHVSDLAEVRIATLGGTDVRFDLNWQRRVELENTLTNALKDFPRLAEPLASPYGLGYRLAAAILKLLGRDP